MEMKPYETPEVEVVLSDSEDVVKTSPVEGGDLSFD